MILDQIPEIQALSREKKEILAQELLDDLNAPKLSPDQEAAMLDVLNSRYNAYRENPESSIAGKWSEVKGRLAEKTGASWQK